LLALQIPFFVYLLPVSGFSDLCMFVVKIVFIFAFCIAKVRSKDPENCHPGDSLGFFKLFNNGKNN